MLWGARKILASPKITLDPKQLNIEDESIVHFSFIEKWGKKRCILIVMKSKVCEETLCLGNQKIKSKSTSLSLTYPYGFAHLHQSD